MSYMKTGPRPEDWCEYLEPKEYRLNNLKRHYLGVIKNNKGNAMNVDTKVVDPITAQMAEANAQPITEEREEETKYFQTEEDVNGEPLFV